MNPLRLLAAMALALAVGLTLPAAAVAFYGNGAQIVSADFERLEQGDDSTVFAAISADGRYVAIQTFARNFFDDNDPDPPGQYRAGGVFRFDLQTKALEKVADGNIVDEGSEAFLRRGASNPSISADGRFVAFATAESLVAADANENVDVYVRDMAIPIGGAGAFDLVSARDGGDVPAGYESASGSGADVSRGVAISADGRKVAFRTVVASDLPAAAGPEVPAGQVFLRDRLTDSTMLVTAKREAGAMTDQPAGGALGAALSADGTTVAWTGANAAAQTRILAGENADPNFLYYLWRRLADGPNAPTRRITGNADPDDPSCPADAVIVFDQTSTGPCYGPLTDQEANRSGIGAQLPALSADGRVVAFLTGAGPRPNAFTGSGLDLYVTTMAPGLTRKESTVELSRDPPTFDQATSSPISSLAMASGGRYLAITTVRTNFVLPVLTFLGLPRPVPGPRELYVVDLEAHTLDRVARSYGGDDIDGDVQNGVTISADGSRVAFTSFAGNLFFGDANQSSDAFVAERQPEQGTGAPPSAPGAGGPDATIERSLEGPRIRVRARSRPGGVVVVSVSVPAAGGVKAVARARAGSPRRLRTLAVGTARARGGGRSGVRILLRPVARYRAELGARGTIRARVAVGYVASHGGRRASASLAVSFRRQVGSKPNTGSQK